MGYSVGIICNRTGSDQYSSTAVRGSPIRVCPLSLRIPLHQYQHLGSHTCVQMPCMQGRVVKIHKMAKIVSPDTLLTHGYSSQTISLGQLQQIQYQLEVRIPTVEGDRRQSKPFVAIPPTHAIHSAKPTMSPPPSANLLSTFAIHAGTLTCPMIYSKEVPSHDSLLSS